MAAPRRIDGPGELVQPGSRPGWLYPGQYTLEVAPSFVARLIQDQRPQWADLPLHRVTGWDNTTYRLGEQLAVRLPRGDWAAAKPSIEYRLLSLLAPHLTLPIPEPIFLGEPALGYPWQWIVYRWIDGEQTDLHRLADPTRLAVDLARFLDSLHACAASNSETPATGGRGGPLAPMDESVRSRIDALQDTIEDARATAIWEAGLACEPADRATWLHGDLTPSNMVTTDGQLSGIIDFGCATFGDRAVDFMGAWEMFDLSTRSIFRDTAQVDARTWARARAWALAYALPLPKQLASSDAAIRNSADAALKRLAQVLLG